MSQDEKLREILKELYIQAQWHALKDKYPAVLRPIEIDQVILAIKEAGYVKKDEIKKVKGLLVEFHCVDMMLSQAIGKEVEIKRGCLVRDK